MDTEYVIDSIEISKIVKMEHSKVLRKIQGANDRKGFIQYLKSYGYELQDYLRLSHYNSKQGKVLICYDFTSKGWQVFINLFTSDRGNLLSDAYVKRFGILKN
ncbi:MAG: Rha family transcriptional regulator [Lactococcus lactis]